MNAFSSELCFTAILMSALVFGCNQGSNEPQPAFGLTKVVLQTDWYAQPEHGGFYQALANGYYKEAVLDVESFQVVRTQ